MFFLFNVPATTELYTLSLHDALPILHQVLMGMSKLALIVIKLMIRMTIAMILTMTRFNKKSVVHLQQHRLQIGLPVPEEHLVNMRKQVAQPQI